MKSLVWVLFVALLSVARAEDSLPFDPERISRFSLDDRPRSLAICPGRGTWLGYDLEGAYVFKVWRAPEGKRGLTSGFVTKSVGKVLFEGKGTVAWSWHRAGVERSPRIRYLGCSQKDKQIELSWELQHESERLTLQERVDLAPAGAEGAIARHIRVVGLGEADELRLPFAVGEPWQLTDERGEKLTSIRGEAWHRLILP